MKKKRRIMLVSLEHKFIFLANLKTASTAIESALRGHCQLALDRSEWGKHVSLSYIQSSFPGLFQHPPRERFTVFGVMRDPVDWMCSLYRSHKSVQFEGSLVDTTGMSFEEFLTDWCQQNETQVRGQHTLFEDASGRFGGDYIIRYDHLDEDFDRLMRHLGIEGCTLRHENVSVDPPALDVVTRREAAMIYMRYRLDRRILRARGGVLPSPVAAEGGVGAEDDDERGPDEADLADDGLPGDGLDDSERRRRARFASRPITRDDVVWAFRMLLGRDPESEAAVQHHLGCRTRDELRALIMGSGEFMGMVDRQRGAAMAPATA